MLKELTQTFVFVSTRDILGFIFSADGVMENTVLNLIRTRCIFTFMPYAEQLKHASSPSDGIWVANVFPSGDSSFLSTVYCIAFTAGLVRK